MSNLNTYALVIGGSKGLGLGTVRKLCAEGYPVIVLHRDRRKDLDEIMPHFEAIREAGGELHTYQMDALNADKRKDLIGSLPEILGASKIGVVVYSIAKGNLKPLYGASSSDRLNATDFMLTTEAMAYALHDWISDLMDAQLLAKDTRVIAFTSEGSRRILPNYGAVAAAKAALEALIRQMAVEGAHLGIKANCIQAGVTKTASLELIPGSEEILKQSTKRNPHGRLTLPSDVADAVYLLCRPEAAWITGNIICVDGGENLN